MTRIFISYRRQDSEGPGGPLGLPHAGLIEGDVGLALEAVLDVPGRLPVPP